VQTGEKFSNSETTFGGVAAEHKIYGMQIQLKNISNFNHLQQFHSLESAKQSKLLER